MAESDRQVHRSPAPSKEADCVHNAQGSLACPALLFSMALLECLLVARACTATGNEVTIFLGVYFHA